jgi:hypothetical protein
VCAQVSAISASRSDARTLTLHTLVHYACPVGSASPDGRNDLAPCALCPSGGFELANDTDRTACANLACAEGWWCGRGAVEGWNYVPVLSFDAIAQTLVVSAKRQVSWAVTNDHANDTLFVQIPLDLVRNPWFVAAQDGSVDLNQTFLAVAPGEIANINLNFDARFIPSGQSTFEAQFPLDWWTSAFDRADTNFSVNVSVVLRVTTILVTPLQFSYTLSSGSAYNVTTLNPVPQVQILNNLCGNSITYVIKQGCDDVPDSGQVPPWFVFQDPLNTPHTIPSQSGLPDQIGFSINLTGPVHDALVAKAVDRAEDLLSCFTFQVQLIGLETNVTVVTHVGVKPLIRCPPGYFSGSGDNLVGCSPCSTRTYQDQPGSTLCVTCASAFPTTLQEASTNASDCVTTAGSFAMPTSGAHFISQICPAEANCSHDGLTLQTLPLKPGYWRTNVHSSVFLKCTQPQFCLGGLPPVAQVRLRRRDLASPANVTVNSSAADATNSSSFCAPNHNGVFCLTCEPGYVHRGGKAPPPRALA